MRDSSFFMIGDTLYVVALAQSPQASSAKAVQEMLCRILGQSARLRETTGFFIGPRPELTTSWCSNVVGILHEAGVRGVMSVERYRWIPAAPSSPEFDDLTEVCVPAADIKRYFAEYEPTQALRDGTVPDIAQYAKDHRLNFDEQDTEFYVRLFRSLGRDPTVAELHDLANSNSEHSRHHLFRAKFRFEHPRFGMCQTQDSMMDMVKETLPTDRPTNSLVAFSDNASAIRGRLVDRLVPSQANGPSALRLRPVLSHISLTAETHNMPTGIAPFQGATTGTGGRIRDTQAIGRGGSFVAGTAGYCVGSFTEPQFDRIHPIDMLLRASDGASDYGNKIGEPVIQGFCRAFGDERTYEWTKPIMFSGGIGHVNGEHLHKAKPLSGWNIVRVGGPTYRLGLGGGAASSVTQSSDYTDALRSSVQRGDAQCQNRMDAWLRACLSLGERNPVLSIHDQGAGGMANVTKEILDGVGGVVDLKKVTLGDQSLSDAEIWVSESQEQNTCLIAPENITLAREIAHRERVHLDVIGTVRDTGFIEVLGEHRQHVVKLPLASITPPVKTFDIVHKAFPFDSLMTHVGRGELTKDNILQVLSKVDVGSKRFLTSKVDRSVGGLVAQQQCVGPFQTPIANVAVVANSYFEFTGAATAIGERTILKNERSGSETCIKWSIFEMLTNIMWAAISDLSDIKCSGNWMWPAGSPSEKARMLEAASTVRSVLKQLGISIDGGKDSVSMSAKLRDGRVVNSPPTFVISGYAPCIDVRLTVQPGLKQVGSSLILVRINGCEGVKKVFRATQTLLRKKRLLSGHDVSDGGIITTICEMCFASETGIGIDVTFPLMMIAFNEDPHIIVEVDPVHVVEVMTAYPGSFVLGQTISEYKIVSTSAFNPALSEGIDVRELRDAWESTATMLERRQTSSAPFVHADVEHTYLTKATQAPIAWPVSDEVWTSVESPRPTSGVVPIRVAVIRGEGTNGHREMAAVLHCAGFEVHDVTTSDMTDGRLTSLDHFSGIVFPGGFTYSDVLGSAAGWHSVLVNNARANAMIQTFRERPDTFVLGVCNGCQLLSRLGWIGADAQLSHNQSGRFESRFVTVKIASDIKTFWLNGLEDATLGVWVAHGEGRFTSDDETGSVALRYVDPESGAVAGGGDYPMNPNGSANGVAGKISADGRVLAMMPHPERCFKGWQLPWCPPEWRARLATGDCNTPWLKLFQNAYEWAAASGDTKDD